MILSVSFISKSCNSSPFVMVSTNSIGFMTPGAGASRSMGRDFSLSICTDHVESTVELSYSDNRYSPLAIDPCRNVNNTIPVSYTHLTLPTKRIV